MQIFVVVFALTIGSTWGENGQTPSEQCSGTDFDNLRERFHVVPCGGATRCELIKNTNVTVIIKFRPKSAITTLKNNVVAFVLGVPLPYVGVDGAEACGGNITVAESGARADCPLAADTEYIYTTAMLPVQNVYPSVSLTVHWALQSGDDLVMCAEVPAVIKKA